MPKYKGLCPVHHEIDLYTGCPFGCLYCVEHGSQESASVPAASAECFIEGMKEKNSGRAPVYISPRTDAYQPLEGQTGLARSVLEYLSANGLPYFVITKGTLVARDWELFAGRSNAFIAMSINTLDESVTGRLEPSAPQISERVQCAEFLASIGSVRLVIKIDPVIPGITDGPSLGDLLDWCRRLRPYAVTAETLRLSQPIFMRMRDWLTEAETAVMKALYPELNGTPRHAGLEYRTGLFSGIASRLKSSQIRACFCRASLPDPITPYDCRGGYP